MNAVFCSDGPPGVVPKAALLAIGAALVVVALAMVEATPLLVELCELLEVVNGVVAEDVVRYGESAEAAPIEKDADSQ